MRDTKQIITAQENEKAFAREAIQQIRSSSGSDSTGARSELLDWLDQISVFRQLPW